ncbi:hypothetical protein C8R44DRAFT_887055 [Mycena epipterygia]|nr:hypothetical protein C8R44DRAFT_887055 [Mycena epipterygia]
MSLSRALGDSVDHPLVVDARGHLVQAARPRKNIFRGRPSTIIQHTGFPASCNLNRSVSPGPATASTSSMMTSSTTTTTFSTSSATTCCVVPTAPSIRATHIDAKARQLQARFRQWRIERADAAAAEYRARSRRVMPPQPVSAVATRIRNRNSEAELVARNGGRPKNAPEVQADDLWLTAVRPVNVLPLAVHHLCTICQGVKSHPVSYKCGHSDCYVCIRLWLEKSWKCPSCMTTMHGEPFRHYAEEAELESAYPGRDVTSGITYTWEGLQFPKKFRVIVPQTPSP